MMWGKAMNRHDQPYDWQRFWIHFVCGALIGGGIGFFYWFRHWHAGLSVWGCTAFPSLALALLGGVFGDCFWEGFLKFIRRWYWWV
ncbi:hypothetical protein Gura_2102 [Geotalea uraniireducens Rf4]|uniref:Uncharacterized protein n=2 Tax=Geotalea uraniireducens TaxID=351604 RepID=A5G3C2_GEOUR|nr:hypothetical protein Gura_2102 [Geotalea uraniireducens Rf4]